MKYRSSHFNGHKTIIILLKYYILITVEYVFLRIITTKNKKCYL